MKLILARHGETDWNVAKKIQGVTDTNLNENGLRQARELAAAVLAGDLGITAIYSSHLKRAAQTAAYVAGALNLPYHTMEALQELNFGKWEGNSWPEVKERYPEEYGVWYTNRRYTPAPEGESYQQMLERVIPALQEIVRREKGNALVVIHSAEIVALQAALHNTSFQTMAKDYPIGNAQMVELGGEQIGHMKV